MKLTRRKFLKALCAIPFLPYALPKKELKEDLSSNLLFVPEELEAKARELMSSYHIGDLISWDENGRITPFTGKNRLYGTVIGFQSDGTVEVKVCNLERRGHK